MIRGVLGILLGAGVLGLSSPALAADRAYELVTPPGGNARALPGSGMATPDGDVVCFDAEMAAAGAPANGLIAPDGFCSWRTESGWDTKWVTGPGVTEPRAGYGAAVYFVSPDGRRVAFATDKGIYPDFPGAPTGGTGNATQSAYMWEGGGMPRWLAPAPEPLQESVSGNGNRNPLAASDDLRHGVFQSGLKLVPQDTNEKVDVYEWTPDGIRLVSRDASGAAAGGAVPLRAQSSSGIGSVAHAGTISRDGSRIFFQHGGPLVGGEPNSWQNVYMREGDELRLVSPRRGGAAPRHIMFAGASEDGEIVYLQTAEQLTPEPKQAGDALYRYDVASDTLSLAATAPTGVFFLGVSADGSTVVYRNNDRELLVARHGVVTTLGVLDALDLDYNTVGSAVFSTRALRIAPDGSAIAFSSWGSFDGTPGGMRQVYGWTAGQGLERISAPADGALPAGHADIGNFSVSFGILPRFVGLANTMRDNPLLGRVLADDGRVFFESAEQLVDDDVNDYVDVYEWHDGTIRLISPGTQRANALYHDNSADGSTVFFTTSARLIPELDRNQTTDLYAARVGGGFALPQPPVECQGEGCQGPGPSEPRRESPATRDYRGSGNAGQARALAARLSVAPVTAAQRRSLVRKGRMVLRARVTKRGIVTLAARAKVAGQWRVVARSVRVVRPNARTGLSLRLSKRARTALRKKNGLRLVINVRYSESNGSVRRVVMLRG